MTSLSDIISKVHVILNELVDLHQPKFLSEDKLELDLYIAEAIRDAILFVQHVSPVKNVNPKSVSVSAHDNGEGVGYIECPDDYVTLIGLKMNGWKRICTKSYPIASEMYKIQANETTRSGVNKPCCIDFFQNGKRILEYYSIPPGVAHVVDLFVYESLFNPNEGLNCTDENLYLAVCYKAASIVYQIFESNDSSLLMEKECIKYISNLNTEQ